MPNREPTSRKEFEMDVRAYCRMALILFGNPNDLMEPEDYIFLKDMGRLFHRLINRLLARHHYPPWSHAKKNPNYDEWHNYREMKWLDTLYRIFEKRYIKPTPNKINFLPDRKV